jgi:thioredoxin-related protein
MKNLLFILLLMPLISFTQLNIYSANELDSLQYIEERPVVFFVNTDWCSICLAMENKVLKSEGVSKELNENYYLVFLNAESKEDIVYKGKRYTYEASGIDEGKHQLAMQLAKMKGTISFPSTVLIVRNSVIYKNNSFMNEEDLLEVLRAVSKDL